MGMVITIKGLDLTKEHLTRFQASLADMAGTMERIGLTLAHYYANESFVSQGGVYGQPWAPLTSSTAAYKASHYPGRGPLVRTGEMQNSFAYTVTPRSVTVHNTVQVGEYNLLSLHQKGTSRGIPPRTVMALNETLRREVEAIVVEDIALKIEDTRVAV